MVDGKAVRRKLIGSDDERAVSPVIGVILMVAITVILAAVIAAFVMDMGSSQSAPAQAGIEISGTSSPYEVTVTSMGSNAEAVFCSNTTASDYESGVNGSDSVGTSFDCPGGENIIGLNDEGKETVIQSNIGD